MRFGPPFRYARRQDGRHIAYQVVGEGDLDLVFLLGWPTHLGLVWENPSFAGRRGAEQEAGLADPGQPGSHRDVPSGAGNLVRVQV